MATHQKKAIRAAIYCRCSTDEQWQGKDFSTLESQVAICKHAIAMKEHEDGWSLGQIFEDGGYSGGSIERPALQELIDEIEAGNIQAVVVYRLDRLTRSIADFYELWKIFEIHGVVFVSATEAFSTDTPTGELFLNLLLSLAQWERQLTKQRVADKIAERSKRGYWNGGNPPFGYDYSKDEKLLIPNKQEAQIVTNVFELAAQYGTPTEIAKQLNKDGIKTKSFLAIKKDGKTKMMGGKRWVGQNVTRLVRNAIYKGIIVHGDNEYEGRHKALVDSKLWERANKKLVEKKPAQSLTRRSNRHEMLLKGILKCDHCNRHLVPKPAGKKDSDGNPYLYYTCGDLNKHGKKTDCVLRNIPARAFEDFIIKLLAELGKHPDVVKATAEAAKREHQEAVKPFEAKLRRVTKELDEASKEVASLIDMAKRPEMKNLSGDFMAEADALGKRKSDLQVERQKLQMEIDYRSSLVVDETILCKNLTDFAALFEKLTFEERAELVSLLFKEIRVSRFDPEKDEHSCDPDVFVTQMRTSWYRVDLRMFSKSFKMKDLLGKGELEPEVRNKNKNGGEGGIRTLGAVSSTHPFQGCTIGHSVTSPLEAVEQNLYS